MTDHADPVEALEKAMAHLQDTLILAEYAKGDAHPDEAVLQAAARNEVNDLAAMRRHVLGLVDEVREVGPADQYVQMWMAFKLAQLDGLSIAEGVVAVEILVPAFELANEILRDAS